MCKFFSLVSYGYGNVKYFNYKVRKQIISGELNLQTDSHASICDYFHLPEDKWNKYEFNPLTKIFEIDQINARENDSKKVERWCLTRFNIKEIVPEMIIKPIINPFTIGLREVTEIERQRLKMWASVGASVWASVRDSVRASVGASVWASVWASVRDSVRASVGASVWASVRDSVRDSVRAYISSFLPGIKKWKNIPSIEEGGNPFLPAIDLWETGIVPSFDGTIWRLHGYEGKIIYKIAKVDL